MINPVKYNLQHPLITLTYLSNNLNANFFQKHPFAQIHKTLSYIIILLATQLPSQALAASLPAEQISLWWCTPFIGILLTIALCPLLLPQLWHKHTGKIIASWILLLLVPLSIQFGLNTCFHIVTHAIIIEYIPFILLLSALYTISGGIVVNTDNTNCIRNNLWLLTIGTLLAGVMGTTAASTLLIRPLLRTNANRKHRTHIVIFFILLVSNIGGGLTPLGDPPLFLGFLRGVNFIWTVQHMFLPVLMNSIILLSIFFLIDNHFWHQEQKQQQITFNNHRKKWQIQGKLNLLLLFIVIAIVVLSGTWQSTLIWNFWGIEITAQAIIRDGLLLLITLAAFILTPSIHHQQNEFHLDPILEISKLFIGIFITISPVILILQAGKTGHLYFLINLLQHQSEPDNTLYFWMSGLLSSFLDNAPTYLIFFNLAGNNAHTLMQLYPNTLLAISMGSVFMGALTYIGNAPNLMVKAIAEQQHVKMPNFLSYIMWASVLLIPLFILDTLLFL